MTTRCLGVSHYQATASIMPGQVTCSKERKREGRTTSFIHYAFRKARVPECTFLPSRRSLYNPAARCLPTIGKYLRAVEGEGATSDEHKHKHTSRTRGERRTRADKRAAKNVPPRVRASSLFSRSALSLQSSLRTPRPRPSPPLYKKFSPFVSWFEFTSRRTLLIQQLSVLRERTWLYSPQLVLFGCDWAAVGLR